MEALKEELNATIALCGETSTEAEHLRASIDACPNEEADDDNDDEAEDERSSEDEMDLNALSSDSSEGKPKIIYHFAVRLQ